MEKQEIEQLIADAMKSGDKDRVSVLRQVLQGIKQIEVDSRREATDADVVAVARKLMKVTVEELDGFERNPEGRADRIATLRNQISVLKAILPERLSGADLEKLVDEAIAKTGASGMRDMGRVMAELSAAGDRIELGEAAAYAKAKLG